MPGAIRCKNGATPPRNAVVCQRNWTELGRRHHCAVGFTENLGLFEVPKRVVGWLEHEIDTWLGQKAAAARAASNNAVYP